MLPQLEVSGLTRQLAINCVLIGRKGNVVRLGLDPRNNMMRVQGAVDKLTQALSKYLGEPVRIEFEAPISGAETPAQAEQRAAVERVRFGAAVARVRPGGARAARDLWRDAASRQRAAAQIALSI
ncbi:MAG: DNA polymerase III subunit gamma/tau C-terminal domain-containing protein [Gammaproteobacteria bacterium]